MDKKEQILDLYFNKHLKQKEIADIANMLLDVKEKQQAFKKAFGNSYSKNMFLLNLMEIL